MATGTPPFLSSNPKIIMNDIDLDKTYSANIFNPHPIVFTKGEGSYLYDELGKRYIDFMTGYSSVILGHCHPSLVVRAKSQLETLTMSSRAFYNDVTSRFVSDLCVFTGFDRALVTNSGAEAIEAAIKIARLWGYTEKGLPPNSAKIIVFDGNFHGRTTTIVGFSSEAKYRDGFGPYDNGFVRVRYNHIPDLEQELKAHGSAICGILIEPVQGEAGIIIPDEGYLAAVRELANKYGCLLICDEIQSGFGRTGKMFAFEHENIRPDLLVIGKGLGGGIVPISAVVGTEFAMEHLQPGHHGSTFGGNPFACAIASEVLYLFKTNDYVQRSKILGDYFYNQLEDRVDMYNPLTFNPRVESIRQMGLWVAIDIHPGLVSGREFSLELAERGVICRETHNQTIRIAPALNISKEVLDEGIDILIDTLNGKYK